MSPAQVYILSALKRDVLEFELPRIDGHLRRDGSTVTRRTFYIMWNAGWLQFKRADWMGKPSEIVISEQGRKALAESGRNLQNGPAIGAQMVARRYAKMTPEERSEAARNAAVKKWAAVKKKGTKKK